MVKFTNKIMFFKSTVMVGREKRRYLHFEPSFDYDFESYDYEIYGTDKTRIVCTVSGKEDCNKIISFRCELGHTYFIKVNFKNGDNEKEYFSFYRMEEDFDENLKLSNAEVESEDGEEESEEESNNQESNNQEKPETNQPKNIYPDFPEIEDVDCDEVISRKNTGLNTGLNIEADNEIDFTSI